MEPKRERMSPDSIMPWEVAELVRQKTGLRLGTRINTNRLIIFNDALYYQALFGPYTDIDDPDMTIFVSYRVGMGPGPYMQLLVCDVEGDFLNSNAWGAEKYNLGLIR